MRRVRVTPYERGVLAVAVLATVAGLLLLLLSDSAADHRLAMSLNFFGMGIVTAVLVLRAERAKSDQP